MHLRRKVSPCCTSFAPRRPGDRAQCGTSQPVIDHDSAGHVKNDEEQSDLGSHEISESTMQFSDNNVEQAKEDEEDDDDDFHACFEDAIKSCRRDSLSLKKYQGRRLAQ
jgi:ferredoxin